MYKVCIISFFTLSFRVFVYFLHATLKILGSVAIPPDRAPLGLCCGDIMCQVGREGFPKGFSKLPKK